MTGGWAVQVQNAVAVGSQFNDELTIIFTCCAEVREGLADDDPIRTWLAEIEHAAQRCAWRASALINLQARVAPVQAPRFDALVEMDRMLQELFGRNSGERGMKDE